jgi:uncharacterized flavoprotein (TIGR03862 family)
MTSEAAKASQSSSVAIIGAGPAGFMAAEVLSQSGASVNLYDAMPSAGRKFLIAGKGGLNLTHSEADEQFLSRYGSRRHEVKPWLDTFSPQMLRDWVHALGFETFVGSSGRVFPTGMNSGPLLTGWIKRLRNSGVEFHFSHRWDGWTQNGDFQLSSPAGELALQADAVLLALGGGSYPDTGSNGAWIPWLVERGVVVAALEPSNCGFDIGWTDHFRTRFAGHPVKSVSLTFDDTQGRNFQREGEFIITETGVEGSLIYAVSARLREEIKSVGRAVILLDLAPGRSLSALTDQLSRPRGSRSMASHLRRQARIEGVKSGLLREFLPQSGFSKPAQLAAGIKNLQIPLVAPRPLEEAISSAGGVKFDALDSNSMLRALPGVFCAGEMIDWEAPTGGYLLTACMASGRMAGMDVVEWLRSQSQ